MDYLSIGIGILSVGSGLLFKVVGYVRKPIGLWLALSEGCRALASFERGMSDLGHQIQDHVTQSQAEFRGIKEAIDRLESRINEARDNDGSDY